MAFNWDPNWAGIDPKYNTPNNNGATVADITQILSQAAQFAGPNSGDPGLIAALSQQDPAVTILKGIHQEDKKGVTNTNPHLTVLYLGGEWHVNLAATNTGGYRFRNVTQWKD